MTTWTADQRAEAREAWAVRNPEKAAVRAAIVAAEDPRRCDRCDHFEGLYLVVMSYDTGRHVWRCKPCLNDARSVKPETRHRQPKEAA